MSKKENQCCEKCKGNFIKGFKCSCPCHQESAGQEENTIKELELWEEYVIGKGKYKYIREDIYNLKINQAIKEQRESLVQEIGMTFWGTITLWRPFFYRDKINEKDIKELKKLLEQSIDIIKSK